MRTLQDNTEEAVRHVELIKDLRENYLSVEQVAATFGVKRFRNTIIHNRLKELYRSEKIPFIELDIPFERSSLYVKKIVFLNFKKQYISVEEACSLLGIKKNKIGNLMRNNNIGIRKIAVFRDNTVYKKEDLERVVLPPFPVDLYPEEYYTGVEARRILGFSKEARNDWTETCDEFEIPSFRKSTGRSFLYYNKKQIDELRDKQLEYRAIYYSAKEVYVKVPYHILASYGVVIKAIRANALIRLGLAEPRMVTVYEKKVIDAFLNGELELIDEEWATPQEIIRIRPNVCWPTSATIIYYAVQGYISSKEVDGRLNVNIEEAIRHVELIKDLRENYLSIKQVTATFGIGRARNTIMHNRLKELYISEQIPFKELDIPFERSSLYVIKTAFLNFKKQYISAKEVCSLFGINKTKIEKLMRDNNINIRKIAVFGNNAIYKKEDLERVLLPSTADLYPEEYYSGEEARRILGFPKMVVHGWTETCDEFQIPSFRKRTGTVLYYNKKQIDELREKQLEYLAIYYSAKEVCAKVPHHILQSYGVLKKSIHANALMRFGFAEPMMFTVYERKVIDAFLNGELELIEGAKAKSSYKPQTELFIDYKGPLFKAFELKLQELGVSDEVESKTKLFWLRFCKEKLKKADHNKSLKTRKENVVNHAENTKRLFEFLQDRELFNISANEINLGLLKFGSDRSKRQILWSFCKKLYSNFFGKEGINLSFKPRQLEAPYREETKNKKDKGIYQYGEYLSLLEYATNMEIHKNKAIDDALYRIRLGAPSNYASAWLYVLVSLNNAWRHPDIIYNLTQVSIDRLNIKSLDDLRHRNLTFNEADLIITEIMTKDNSHTKTDAIAQFNCSSDVTVSLATAAIICTLISRELHLGQQIINFSNENDDFRSNVKKTFFAEFNHDFSFQIQKMNRSLLTYVYLILVEKGYHGAALEIAKKLRSHYDFESTNFYIQIPREKLDQLSKQTFCKRTFGFIRHAFLDVMYGPENDRQKRTDDIVTLNSILNIHQIQATSGFVTKVHAEKHSVIEYILKLGLEKTRELMFKINANLLASKEPEIQCLLSEEECVNPKRECLRCAYKIVNFYTISAIVQSFTNLLDDYSKTFISAEDNKTQKTKLANLLYIHSDILQEACDEFGADVVLSFFKNGEEEYNALLGSVNQIYLATGEDVEKYKTYKGCDDNDDQHGA